MIAKFLVHLFGDGEGVTEMGGEGREKELGEEGLWRGGK